MNYFTVIPVLIFSISSVIALKDKNLNYLPAGLALLLIFIAYFHGEWKPMKIITSKNNEPAVTQKNFDFISDSDKIITSESLVPLIEKNKYIYIISMNPVDTVFDYVIVRKNEENLIGVNDKKIISGYKEISSDKLIIYKK